MHKTFSSKLALSLVLTFLSSHVMAAASLSILPVDYTYQDRMVALGSTLTVPYKITNNTPKTLCKIRATHLPKGITSSMCAKLAPQASCILNLKIDATLTSKPGVIDQRFKVFASSPRLLTYVSVHPKNRLNINVTNTNTFLAITDTHLKAGKTSPINYGEDTNDLLWSSTLTQISKLVQEQSPQFVVLLGDLPAHRDRPNLEKNISAVLRSLSGLDVIRRNKLPVFFVFGNNDSLVVNYGPLSDGTRNLFSLDPQHNWPALNTNPDCSVSPNAACTFTATSPMPDAHAEDMAYAQTRGYYSAYPLGSAYPLRFIALNSVIFSHEYYQSGAAQLKEAQEQMDWLAKQLSAASVNHEAVYIGMHIPAGADAYHHGADMWNDTLLLNNGLTFRDAFLALMSQYKQNVRTVMTGHTHYNEFRALHADKSLANLSVLGTGIPGITPNHFNNPGMQIYLYDDAYRLAEAKTYYTTPEAKDWKNASFQHDYDCAKNSTMLQCVETKLLSKLPEWTLPRESLTPNPYQINYSLRAPDFDPIKSGVSNWLAVLNTIQVVPTH